MRMDKAAAVIEHVFMLIQEQQPRKGARTAREFVAVRKFVTMHKFVAVRELVTVRQFVAVHKARSVAVYAPAEKFQYVHGHVI
jgi:hypothetical protein